MSLSKSAVEKIDNFSNDIFDLENIIIQETDISDNASLTTTTYIISDVRTPPRPSASISEILAYLHIHNSM